MKNTECAVFKARTIRTNNSETQQTMIVCANCGCLPHDDATRTRAMTAAMEKERADFELAHTDCDLSRHLYYPDCYADSHVQAAWNGWKRARSLASPQVPVEAIHYAISQIVTNQNNLRSIIPATYAHSNHENMAVKHIAALRALLPEEKA